jgi:protein-arginine kinase activator protein McsA
MEKNKYREDICPHCEHEDNNDFEYEAVDVNMSESVSQQVECGVCGTKWLQIYKLKFDKIVNVRKPKNDL